MSFRHVDDIYLIKVYSITFNSIPFPYNGQNLNEIESIIQVFVPVMGHQNIGVFKRGNVHNIMTLCPPTAANAILKIKIPYLDNLDSKLLLEIFKDKNNFFNNFENSVF